MKFNHLRRKFSFCHDDDEAFECKGKSTYCNLVNKMYEGGDFIAVVIKERDLFVYVLVHDFQRNPTLHLAIQITLKSLFSTFSFSLSSCNISRHSERVRECSSVATQTFDRERRNQKSLS